MLEKFEEIRQYHNHTTVKGTNAELVLRDFLREFLPFYNRIGTGEIIDSYDAVSKQIDLVITNEFHPFLNDLTRPSTFIIEGVMCAAEVKSVLTTTELKNILINADFFKSLKPFISSNTIAIGNEEDLHRFIERKPYFAFCFSSQLQLGTIKKSIEEYYAASATPYDQQLDALFLLDRGSLINFGLGNGTFCFRSPDGQKLPGWIYREPVDVESLLVTLLSWVSALPRVQLGSLPINRYLIKSLAELNNP